jgi:hypothetical protein
LRNLLSPPTPKPQRITAFDAMSGSSKVVTAVPATALLIALVTTAVRVRSQPAASLGTGL